MGTNVPPRLLLGVEHRLAEGGITLVIAEFHIAVALTRYRRHQWQDFVLSLIDGHRAFLVGEIGRREVLEQGVGDHLVDVFDVAGVQPAEVAGVDQIHVVVGSQGQRRILVFVPARHIALLVTAAHCGFQFHQRRITVGLGPILVVALKARWHEQHQFHFGRHDRVLRNPAGQPTHVQEGAGTGAPSHRADHHHTETVCGQFQAQPLELCVLGQAGLQVLQLDPNLVADARVLVEEIQARNGPYLPCTFAGVYAQAADSPRRER